VKVPNKTKTKHVYPVSRKVAVNEREPCSFYRFCR